MSDFYKNIAASIQEEQDDDNKYLILAAEAPTEKARKILTDIAAEEVRHREFLKEILSDGNYQGEKNVENTKQKEV